MLRKNTASQVLAFAGINATTGAALTGATFSYRRCIDGTFAAGGGTITEDTGTGFYKVALAQADTNGNDLAFFFTATNAIPVCINALTTAADPSDTVRYGLTALPNVASGSAGAIVTSGTGTAQLSVSAGLVTLAGVTHTGAVIPTVTTTTTATNLTNERGKYTHGAVWIGPTANTNTVNYTDGILTNPVSTIAAAKTIADSLGLKRFWVQSGVTISLLADMDAYVFDGFNYNFNTSGGTRSISGTVIRNAFVGTAASVFSGANPPYFDNCEFGTNTVTLPPANLSHCEFNSGVITLGVGNTDLIDCCSVVAGSATPSFTIQAGTVNVSFRRWSGGITIGGITSGTTIIIDVVSGGTITLNGADGTVNVRGMINAITDNRTGTPTLNQLAALNRTVLATPTNITGGTITTATNVTTVNGLAANVITAASMAADAGAEIADAVWDEALSGHLSAGSTGEALNAAGAAGDPWTTALPGAYGAGSAGYIIGTNVNATVSSRSTLDAAGVRTAVGLASANLDTQLTAIDDYLDTEVAAIKTKTDYLPSATAGSAGGLFIAGANAATSITTALTANIVGDITGNLSGSVGSVTGNVTGSIGSLAAQAKTDVNAEVLDVLNTDTFAEPGQEAPGATVSLAKKISYLYKAWRNKSTQTATTYSLYADDATTVDQKAAVSDDATTAVRGEIATGP